MPPLTRTAAAVLFMLVLPAHAARAQDVDQELRVEIERLLEVTGAGAIGSQMAGIMVDQMTEAMKRRQPQAPERAIAIVKEVLNTEFSRAFAAPGGLRDQLVRIYAKYFTREDVAALLAFYSTDIGRKAIAVLPMLGQESAMAGQAWGAANTPRVAALIEQRLRDEGFLK
jgi:hypothetical protein